MTQRIFDIENEKDMQDLWNILPDDVVRIKPAMGVANRIEYEDYERDTTLLAIDWHDKTEITRPMSEATKEDVRKLCFFWDKSDYETAEFGILDHINYGRINSDIICEYVTTLHKSHKHCRRLTKQEIEELC